MPRGIHLEVDCEPLLHRFLLVKLSHLIDPRLRRTFHRPPVAIDAVAGAEMLLRKLHPNVNVPWIGSLKRRADEVHRSVEARRHVRAEPPALRPRADRERVSRTREHVIGNWDRLSLTHCATSTSNASGMIPNDGLGRLSATDASSRAGSSGTTLVRPAV